MFPWATLACWDLSSTQVKSGQPDWGAESGWLGVICNQPFTEGVSFFWFFKIEVEGERGRCSKWCVFKKKKIFCNAPKWTTLAWHGGLNVEHDHKRTERIGSHSLPPLWLPPDIVLIHTYKAGARESHKHCNSYCSTYYFLEVVAYFSFL